jgi:hypothetical protein
LCTVRTSLIRAISSRTTRTSTGRVGWALPTMPTTGSRTFFQLGLNSRDLLCYSRRMNETQLIQGRLISPEDIEQIRALMIENPKWHRTRLSIEICRRWNWIDATGRLKDMACRTLLLKLDRRGLIHLPARVGHSTNHRRSKSFQPSYRPTTHPQVWNERSVDRLPDFMVASYSFLLLASLQAYGARRSDQYLRPAKWQRNRPHPSCLDLISLLRKQAFSHPELLRPLNIDISADQAAIKAAA